MFTQCLRTESPPSLLVPPQLIGAHREERSRAGAGQGQFMTTGFLFTNYAFLSFPPLMLWCHTCPQNKQHLPHQHPQEQNTTPCGIILQYMVVGLQPTNSLSVHRSTQGSTLHSSSPHLIRLGGGQKPGGSGKK